MHTIRRQPVLAFAAALFIVGNAWLWCTPPGDAPDEVSHYVRMVGLGQGDLFGRAVDAHAPINENFSDAPEGMALERLNLESGTYALPAEAPPPSDCNQFDGGRPYDCPGSDAAAEEARSFHARSLPTSYAFPALLSRLGDTGVQKTALGRLGYLLQGIGLLSLAAVAVAPVLQRRGNGLTLVVLAITPLVTYQLAMLAPSGTEWAAVVAFAATLIRALHDPRPRWIAACAGAVVLATLTRDLGIFLAPMTALIVVTAHGERARAALRSPRRAAPLLVCAALAWAAAAAWRLGVQAPTGTPEVSVAVLTAFVRHTASLLLFSVGRVGWLVTVSGLVVSAVWLAVAAVIVWRSIAGSRRRARVLLVTAACWLLFNAILEASLLPTGFGVQARYALPVLAVGLLAIATIPADRLASEASERRALIVCGWLSAIGHLVVMTTMIWRHTQGLWHGWPFTDPAWTPPIGWPAAVSLVLAAAAVIVIVTTAAATPRSPVTAPATVAGEPDGALSGRP